MKAEPDDPTHVPARLPGMVVSVAVKEGDTVRKGQPLLTIEAMKMQSTLQADRDGKIVQLLVKPGSQVETGDLLLTLD